MPWKGVKDPYKIWLSEIILQQTRVEQGRKYYESFLEAFPAIGDLAKAGDESVFKLWEGLGYYNRCKNLLKTAREIYFEKGGIFPDAYEDIIQLKGIGPYTAAAMLSFAFNKPYAVVDGNVFRVLARIYGIDTPIDSTEGKKYFTDLAHQNLDKKLPGVYNQAIMDFGATVCKPAKPECNNCIMNSFCAAYLNGLVNHLPVKENIIRKKIRHLTWLKISAGNKVLIYKRTANDIWQNLYEFYLVEKEEKTDWNIESVKDFCNHVFSMNPQQINILPKTEQQLTHQKIKAQIIEIDFTEAPDTLHAQQWVEEDVLKQFAFPKLLAAYLDEP